MRTSILIIVIALSPFVVFASCSSSGATVVYVNGIFTTYSDAQKDLGALQVEYIKNTDDYSLKFTNGYNPSHIGGAGDLVETASQIFDNPISNYDRDTILSQIYPQVTTRKILLVGHSQGTFYTNEIYKYFIENGEPKEAVGVYNIATPASSVTGDGAYLTSGNDKVINTVRDLALKIGAKQPLLANIAIPLTQEEAVDSFGGHSFGGVYLAGASARIVSEAEEALKKLSAGEAVNVVDAGCFTPPAKNLAYYAQKSVFYVADAAATGVVAANNGIITATQLAVAAAENGVKDTFSFIQDFLKGFLRKSVDTSSLALVSEVNSSDAAVAEKTNGIVLAGIIEENKNSITKEANQSVGPQKNLNTSNTQDEDSIATSLNSVQVNQPLPDQLSAKVCTFNTNLSPNHQKLLINEVAWMGTFNSANDEWIELKNISGSELDISGWQVLDKNEDVKITFVNKTKMPAGGFLLLERTDDSSVPGMPADVIYSGALSNTNEGLQLFDSQCNLADEVLASPDWPAGIAEARRTMERQPNLSWGAYSGNGEQLGSLLMMGTPKKENSPLVVSQSGGISSNAASPVTQATSTNTNLNHLVISEVQITGGAGQTTNDFIELYNPTDSAINLSGYRLVKRTKTGTSDTSIKSWTSDAFVPAKGFYLWASSNYTSISVTPDATTTATITDDNAITLRQGAADIGTIIDSVGWGENQSGFVEAAVFPANPGTNQSIERKAYNGGCISASGAGEYSGNGCDANVNSGDFELRSVSNPQNSGSFPEPRSAPTAIQNLNASFSSSTLELILSWGESQDYAGATSTTAYILKYATSTNALKDLATLSATSSYKFTGEEFGTTYSFSIIPKDRDGLIGSTTAKELSIASPLTNLYFYKDIRTASSTKYLFDFYYNQYSFAPDPYWNTSNSTWKILVFYLNREAPAEFELNAANNWQPATTTGILDVQYPNCAGGNSIRYSLILPDIDPQCNNGGGVANSALKFASLEDLHLLAELATTTNDISFSPSDYVTVGIYSLYQSGGGDQKFKLAALDKNKYYFQNSTPSHQSPAAPANLEFQNQATSSLLRIVWDKSTDVDTLDSLIQYEINYSTTTLSDSGWQTAPGVSLDSGEVVEVGSRGYTKITVEPGLTYNIALRAKDDFGNVSSVTSSTYAVPDIVPPYGMADIHWGNLISFNANSYPFMASDTPTAILFFLNQSPPVNYSFFNWIERWEIGGANKVLKLSYSACANSNDTLLGGFLMHNGASCPAAGSGLKTDHVRNDLVLGQTSFQATVSGVLENGIAIEHNFSSSDYITIGFYKLSGSTFHEVSIYNKKIYPILN